MDRPLCIPFRTIFIASFITFFGGAFVATPAWRESFFEDGFVAVLDWQTVSLISNSRDGLSNAASVFFGLSWTLLAIAAAVGIVGKLTRKHSLVVMYYTILWVHFGFHFGFCALVILFWFITYRASQAQCDAILQDERACQIVANTTIPILVIAMLLILLIDCCILTFSHQTSMVEYQGSSVIDAAQLNEEQSEDTKNTTIPGNPKMSSSQQDKVSIV